MLCNLGRGGYSEVNVRMIIADEIFSEKMKCLLNMKPKLRADWMNVLSEELCVLASCFLNPLCRNSVLEEMRVTNLPIKSETTLDYD